MHESRLSPCANARHSIENLISKKRPLLLKTAGQQGIVGIMKPNERLFGDLRVCLCATKPIRCGCGRCDACTAMRTIFCNGTVARLRLAFARHLWWVLVEKALFLQRLTSAHSRKRKRPVRTSGPKRELEARRGTGPHTRRGCTVLDLGRCTGTYCFGVAGKLGRGPRVCKAKV